MRLIDADVLKEAMQEHTDYKGYLVCDPEEIIDLAPTVERPHGEWIPITYRDMDAEEIKQFEAEFGTLAEEDKKVFSCHMPEDGQDILISTKYGVASDTCCYDGYGYWLDMHDDWEGVDAWMPYPKPYNKEGEEK